MEPFIFPLFITVAGLFFLIRNILHLQNETKLRKYLESSPKAALLRNKLGMEKTLALSKKYFLPLGTLVSTSLLGFGIWNIYLLLSLGL